MSFRAQHMRGMFWSLGIVGMAALSSLAWHQINSILARFVCFF
ncbi:MAG TPA: hypothetical protein VL128_05015 [Candidatus Eisenbacteria bacterium]|nr:hypothetical protein [Candidatus Eisenbacteria bacterium]